MNPGTSNPFRKQIVAILAILAILYGALAAFSESAKPQHAKLSLIAEHTGLAPGASEWIGVRFELEPGWHIYWINPGDSGEPPKITWHLPNGIQAGDLEFPAPQRIPDHGMMDFGYQGNVVLLSKLTVPSHLASNKLEITADVRYLVCREVCVPGKEHLAMPFIVGKEAKASTDAELIRKTIGQLPQSLPAAVHVSATQRQGAFVINIASRSRKFELPTDFIPADEQVIENSTKPTVDLGKDMFQLTAKKSEQLNHAISQLRGLLITQNKAYNVAAPISPVKGASTKATFQKNQAAKSKE
jgi:DsbC/DsbD-like thiol-disulfide interchange protein